MPLSAAYVSTTSLNVTSPGLPVNTPTERKRNKILNKMRNKICRDQDQDRQKRMKNYIVERN